MAESQIYIGTRPEIIVADTLGQYARGVVEMSRAYNTLLLIYENDLSDNLQAAWAEADRINLKTKPIGQVMNGIEVHTFGLDDFPPNTILELYVQELSPEAQRQGQRAAYKSLLNELTQVSVKVYANGLGNMMLQ